MHMLRIDSHQAPVIERAKRFATNAMACSDCGIPLENVGPSALKTVSAMILNLGLHGDGTRLPSGNHNNNSRNSSMWACMECGNPWKSSTQMATFIGNMINMMIHQWI